MGNTKYYTPTIDEFHVGFEYEIFRDESNYDYWDKTSENLDVHVLLSKLNSGGIRVKYLDREDIESLGFDGYEPPREYNHSWKYKGSREPKLYAWFNESVPIVRIYGAYPQILFHGEIKNKSELKKLMQQLNIK